MKKREFDEFWELFKVELKSRFNKKQMSSIKAPFIAEKLKMTESNVRTTVHRKRIPLVEFLDYCAEFNLDPMVFLYDKKA